MVLLSDDLMDLFVSIIYSYFGLVTLVTDDFFFYGYRCSGGHRVGESEGILKASYTFNWEALLVIICLLVPCDLICVFHTSLGFVLRYYIHTRDIVRIYVTVVGCRVIAYLCINY